MAKSLRIIMLLTGLALVTGLVLPPVKAAQDSLTWAECVAEATQHNPELLAAAAKLQQALADLTITRSAALPEISAEVSAGKSSSAIEGESDSYSYRISGRQLVFDGFKTAYDVDQTAENLKASQYNYQVTSAAVRLNLRTAFIELLKAQELIAITESIALRRQENLKLVELRYQAGREHRGSLLTAQADLAQAELEVTEAQRQLALAQRELSTRLGREKFTPLKVRGAFEIGDRSPARPDFEYLADNTAVLKELIAQHEAARWGLKSARADLFPQLYLSTSVGQSGSEWPSGENDWSAGLSLSFPLYQGGSRVARITQAEAELNQALANEINQRNTVIYNLENAWTEWQNASDRIAVQQKYLEAAAERAKIAQAQYSTGLITFDNWIIIEANLVNNQKSILNYRANMLIAEANWAQAKGEIL